MTTSRLIQLDDSADAPWSREQMRKRRDERRALVISYLDHVDRQRAVGLSARAIAERTGLAMQSVAQTLTTLVDEGVAIKKRSSRYTQTAEMLYFLAPKRAPCVSDVAGAAAIALYRAEKAKRVSTLQDVMSAARAELARLDADAASRKRGGRRAAETSKRKADDRRKGITVGWKDGAH
jgi:DNA-binding transcriptional ArsR family regulator